MDAKGDFPAPKESFQGQGGALPHQLTSADLLDPESWEDVLETCARTMKLAVALTNQEGSLLGRCHNPQPVWTAMGEKQQIPGTGCPFCVVPQNCTAVADALRTSRVVLVHGQAGLAHVAVPLSLDDHPVGALIAGQVFDRYPESLRLERVARHLGISKQALWHLACQQVPMSRTRLTMYGDLLSTLGQAFLRQRYSALLERKLAEAQGELARVIRSLTVGELAASIAHEINQPLGGVITNAEAGLRWLGGETPNLHEARQSLALIVRDGNRASQVIRRIRQFLTKEHPQTTALDINEVIQQAVALAHGALQKSQIVLRMELSTGIPPVEGDRIQLQQVVFNLLINARDAMSSVIDRSHTLVVTSRKLADNSVAVAVRDSGIGVKPEDLNRMFEAFSTTKPMGMGMGLSISRSIIEAHGGRIWAAPNEGPGLTVQFSLPVEDAGRL